MAGAATTNCWEKHMMIAFFPHCACYSVVNESAFARHSLSIGLFEADDHKCYCSRQRLGALGAPSRNRVAALCALAHSYGILPIEQPA
jgi:hypothetical protein